MLTPIEPKDGKLYKEVLLDNLRQTIENVGEPLKLEIESISKLTFKSEGEIRRLKKEDREHARFLMAKAGLRLEELKKIKSSPFFAKCIVEHQVADVRLNKPKTIYFGKYEFSEKNIYSWVAPIATIRFESPGLTSFRLPNGEKRNVRLHERDQYMIVDGKVMFYSTESENQARQLIYQEHFSIKKGAFMLPEIVEVMEKAQDDVIRASYFGPFVISGPAGSGKTTLALHRVAYLAQSPETVEMYNKDTMIVFVQDTSTKEYFSHLLPELGIHDVVITTFYEWAAKILNVDNVLYTPNTEFEFEKLSIKNEFAESIDDFLWKNDVFAALAGIYVELGSEALNKSFRQQKTSRTLDRIDLTIALMLFRKRFNGLEVHKSSNRVMKGGRVVTRNQKNVLNYSLVVVDEFQNYMPEQLELLKSCLNEKTNSVVYVGDMSQKIQHGTINGWDDFGEEIEPARQIKLHKVYRNTKQILRYIQSLGYDIEIPESLKEGPVVVEKMFRDDDYSLNVLDCLDELIETQKNNEVSIGIIGMNPEDTDFIKLHVSRLLKGQTKDNKIKCRLRVSTIREAQGVEFDIVCIVGIHEEMFSLTTAAADKSNFNKLTKQFVEEKIKINKDLIYIGLTRAMNEMYIFGSTSLEGELKGLLGGAK